MTTTSERAATEHKIHDRLPSGFTFANAFQAEEYAATGSVNGAAKVVLVRQEFDQVDLAIRLRPPRSWVDVLGRLIQHEARDKGLCATEALAWYISEYNKGWVASKRQHDLDRAWTSHAFDDGFLDCAAGRAKWHLTYCPDHDVCGEG